jgi:imidazole glycerol-phosphate synthase subunit HisH
VRLNSSGLRKIIEQKALVEKIPILGICVGLQMFMEGSEEGVEPGLGWLKGRTVRFDEKAMGANRKVPNMGWLEISLVRKTPFVTELEDARFYFAHSFHVRPENSSDILIGADYGYRFTAGIQKENLLGVQFHPEKSHRFGMKLLENFATKY